MIIRILFALLLLCAPAWAWNVVMLGGGEAVSGGTCDISTSEVGQRTLFTSTTNLVEDGMVCYLYEADCTGQLGRAFIAHDWTGSDNVKIGVFDSVYQTDLTTVHLPDSNDTILSGSQWVTVSGNADGTWYNSGSNEIGGSVQQGKKYFVCAITDSTAWSLRRTVSGPNYIAYVLSPGSWGSYSSPPSNLSTGNTSWLDYSPRDMSIYVEIK